LWRVGAKIIAVETKQRLPSAIVELHVALNNITLIRVTMEKQQLVPSAYLSSYKIFRNAVNNINVIRSSCKVTGIFSDFLDFLDRFSF
jgi:hypothetical protein